MTTKTKTTSLINTLKKICLSSVLLLISSQYVSACETDNFDDWKACIIQEKLTPLGDEIDLRTFENATFIEKVISLDRKQPEKKFTFDEYLDKIGFNQKATRAKEYLNDNSQALSEVAEQYGVEKEFIVALIAMESDLGRVQGKYNIIDSLATLAYEGRRKAFFESELIKALKLAKLNSIAYENLTGSWAGAMGQCQFMPSSYLNFAVDYNGDGLADIWQNKMDIFASVANYLKQNGWKKGANKVTPITTNKTMITAYNDCATESMGCDYNDGLRLIFMKNHVNKVTAYAAGQNFRTLMHWNKSHYFVISTMMLADALKR
jgi:membrane-bound lytic murein transglycosylase B